MIQSKLTVNGKVIFSGEFPEAATLRKVDEDGLVTTYCDNEFFSSRLTENRVGRYLLLGYEYQSHFCTAFRRKYGMSPTELRELNTSRQNPAPTGKSARS